jgi:hypothetical protein
VFGRIFFLFCLCLAPHVKNTPRDMYAIRQAYRAPASYTFACLCHEGESQRVSGLRNGLLVYLWHDTAVAQAVGQRFSTGVRRRVRRCAAGVWGKSKRENLRNKTSSKSMINIILKNNTIIRILAIELLNTILLLVFIDKISP